MKAEKRAKKFVRLLSEGLNDAGVVIKKKKGLKKYFKNAIDNLPDKRMKYELVENFDEYLKLLVLSKNACPSVDEGSTVVEELTQKKDKGKSKKRKVSITNEDTQVEKRKKKDPVLFPYTLYIDAKKVLDDIDSCESQVCRNLLSQQIGSLRNKLAKNLLDKIVEDEGSWIEESRVLCDAILGNNSAAALKTVMSHFSRILVDQADSFCDLGRKKLQKAQDSILKMLRFFHVKYQKTTGEFGEPKYQDLLAATLSIYFDLAVFVSRSTKCVDRESIPCHLFTVSALLLNPHLHYLYDVLLQQSDVEDEESLTLFQPIIRFVLLQPMQTENTASYTKFICAFKRVVLWRTNLGHGSDEYEKVALSIAAPSTFFKWVTSKDQDILAETPITDKSTGFHVTQFLVREGPADLMDQLLDLLSTGEQGSSVEEVKAVQSKQETQPEPGIFYVDTKANKDVAHMPETEPDDVEVYDFTEADVEKELANMDESDEESSDESSDSDMEAEIRKKPKLVTKTKEKAKLTLSDGLNDEIENEKDHEKEDEVEKEEGERNEEDGQDSEFESDEQSESSEEKEENITISHEGKPGDLEQGDNEINKEEEMDGVEIDKVNVIEMETESKEDNEKKRKDIKVRNEKISIIVIDESEAENIKSQKKKSNNGDIIEVIEIDSDAEKHINIIEIGSEAENEKNKENTKKGTDIHIVDTVEITESDIENEGNGSENNDEGSDCEEVEDEEEPEGINLVSENEDDDLPQISEIKATDFIHDLKDKEEHDENSDISNDSFINDEDSEDEDGDGGEDEDGERTQRIVSSDEEGTARRTPRKLESSGDEGKSPSKSSPKKMERNLEMASPKKSPRKMVISCDAMKDTQDDETQQLGLNGQSNAVISTPKLSSKNGVRTSPMKPLTSVPSPRKSPKTGLVKESLLAENSPSAQVLTRLQSHKKEEEMSPLAKRTRSYSLSDEENTSPASKVRMSPKKTNSPIKKTRTVETSSPRKIETSSPRKIETSSPRKNEVQKEKPASDCENTDSSDEETSSEQIGTEVEKSETGKRGDPSPRRTRAKTRRESGIHEISMVDASSASPMQSPAKLTRNKRKSVLPSDLKDAQSITPQKAKDFSAYDFTSDVETPLTLKPKLGLRQKTIEKVPESPSIGTPKKTRVAELVREEVGSPRRRSRRLSTSLTNPDAEDDQSTASPTISGASSRRKSMGALPIQQESPSKSKTVTRRRSVLPMNR